MSDLNKTEPDLLGDDARFDDLMFRLRKTGIGKSVSASEWEEVEVFINDNLLTEERIMKEYNCGKSVGDEQAVNRIKLVLMEKASLEFIHGHDDKAKQLRELAREIK
jgi:hypothetical protein